MSVGMMERWKALKDQILTPSVNQPHPEWINIPPYSSRLVVR